MEHARLSKVLISDTPPQKEAAKSVPKNRPEIRYTFVAGVGGSDMDQDSGLGDGRTKSVPKNRFEIRYTSVPGVGDSDMDQDSGLADGLAQQQTSNAGGSDLALSGKSNNS